MGILCDGVWHGGDDKQIGASGWEPRQEHLKGYVRAAAGRDGTEFPAEAGRYHLIVCPGCPLSHRTAMLHRMKKLDGVISTALVRPIMGPNGREFGTAAAAIPDAVTGYEFLHQVYTGTDAAYSGRASTPVLWDRATRRIVSNTYRDIFTMLNREFEAFTDSPYDLQPSHRADEIERELARLSAGLLGAVYRCGFSRDQADYETYAAIIDRTIPELADQLSTRPFLLGDDVTEPDLALLAGLVRYDAIYLPLFRCTRQRVEDHPSLTAYIERMFAIPGVADTFDLKLTMTHYYASHVHINPTRIVPLPPKLSWYGRDRTCLAA